MYLRKIFVFLVLFVVSGCVPMQRQLTTATPAIKKTDKDNYSVSVSPELSNGLCNAFLLKIENKSQKDIQVDWNKTLYVHNSETKGGFMYEGIIYSERNNQRIPDFVLAGNSFQKVIWPNIRVTNPIQPYIGWGHEVMKYGDHGVFLTLVVDGQEIHETLVVKLNTTNVTAQ